VPVRDAKKVMRAISDKRSDLKAILQNVIQARADMLGSVANQVLSKLPVSSIEDLVDENTMPGIIENCLEELEYINFILLSLMDEKHILRKQSEEMENILLSILDSRR
jgi:hypothetical protein